jgi:hypothetical protein
MKTLLQEDVNIDKILTYNDEFFRALNDFLPKLNKEQKQVFFDRISDPYGNYSPASLQRISQTLDFFKTESAKKLKLKLTPSLFNTFVGIFGHEVDNIQAAMKYLIEKRIGLYKKMRFLNTPLYKIVSYLVTVILLLGLLGFIFKMEMSRVFIMFFGIIKIFFLLTVPIILFGGITGLLVILSIIAIVLSFISMYIVDLRTKSKTA